jgi:hypothetical protein
MRVFEYLLSWKTLNRIAHLLKNRVSFGVALWIVPPSPVDLKNALSDHEIWVIPPHPEIVLKQDSGSGQRIKH